MLQTSEIYEAISLLLHQKQQILTGIFLAQKMIKKAIAGIFIGVVLTGPLQAQQFRQTGLASFYADKFEGRLTASGEKFRQNKLTAAHKTLPFGTLVRVKNLENGKEVTVRINDRGPFVEGRIIDLSKSAARKLDFIQQGVVRVELVAISSPEPEKKPYSTLDKPVAGSDLPAEPYYLVTASKRQPSGYGVQVGSFTESANMIALTDRLSRRYKLPVFVQTTTIQGVKYYKVVVGKAKNRAKAEKILDRVKTAYPDCFIIKY